MTDDEQLDDDSLMKAALTEPEHFKVVFERHYDAVHGYLARRYGPDVADDVAGEVFAVAFEQRGRYRSATGTARPWLFGIAANVVRRMARDRGAGARAIRRFSAGEPVSVPDPHVEVADAERHRLNRDQMPALLDQLNDRDRDVLLLRCWEDLSYEEIAVALDLPVGTVRSRLARARRALRPFLDGEDIAVALPRTERST